MRACVSVCARAFAFCLLPELDAEADGVDPLDEMMASYSQELPASLVPGSSASSSYTYRLPPSLVPSTVSGDEPAAKRPLRTPPVSPRKVAAKSPAKSPAKTKSSEVESQVRILLSIPRFEWLK